MCPLSGLSTPAAIFARVDLPAPFAPIKATTSPRPIERSTWSNTRSGPYALLMLVKRNTGVSCGEGINIWEKPLNHTALIEIKSNGKVLMKFLIHASRKS